ncbi:hypothetical protein V8E36_009706 [Tilletia maclaganii]
MSATDKTQPCFCGKAIFEDSEDEPSIYCSVECARIDAMRALELGNEDSPPSMTTAAAQARPSLYLGAELLHANLVDGIETLLSPCSELSFRSSVASAGSPGTHLSPQSSNGSSLSPSSSSYASRIAPSQKSTSTGELRAKGSHYRAMAAAAETAELQADAREQREARTRQAAQHSSWSTTSSSPSIEAVDLKNTPRLGQAAAPAQASPAATASAAATERIVSDDMETQSHFMETVLAQLRLPVADGITSPTLAQLLPAFSDEARTLDDEVDNTTPPPPAHPRLSEIYGLVGPSSATAATKAAGVSMEITMSTQSDQTLVEPGSGVMVHIEPSLKPTASASATTGDAAFFSPLLMSSSSSRSTTRSHSSKPSDASTMTTLSTLSSSSLSSITSTRSLVQSRQLRKELDTELRQMAFDLAELQRREREALVYGISHKRRVMGASGEDMLDDGDVFEFEDETSNAVSRTPSSASSVRRRRSNRSSYRWSKADRDLVARCLSTCLTIVEDEEQNNYNTKTESPPHQQMDKALPNSTSCTRIWDGVQPKQSSSSASSLYADADLLPSLEYDLSYFLDLEEAEDEDEDELLRPTYELPLGFLNQPLVHPSSATASDVTMTTSCEVMQSRSAQSLHHARSTPHLFSSAGQFPPVRAAGLASASIKEKQLPTLTVSQQRQQADFEIMAVAPLQLPARPATSSGGVGGGRSTPSSSVVTTTTNNNNNKLRRLKSGNALSSLRDLASSLSNSNSSSKDSTPSYTAGMAPTQQLRNTAGAAASGQMLPVRPTTPSSSSPFLASSTAFFASAFNRHKRSFPSAPLELVHRLPPTTTDARNHNAYAIGAGIAHNAYGVSALNKRLSVTPAGVGAGAGPGAGAGMSRAKALDKLQGLLKRRIGAGSAAGLR